MNKIFTFYYNGAFLWGFLLIAMLSFQLVHAQNVRLSGRITDSDGAAVPGVNVVIKGTSAGTSSDSNGAYALDVQDQNATLVFSFIGYTTQEVPVNGRSNIDIVLQSDIQTLSEVVVVGYGSQFEKEITGAVQQLKSDELRDIPVAQM